MAVDTDPQALADFAARRAESGTLGPRWTLVSAAALAGRAPLPGSNRQFDGALQAMMEAVRQGDIGHFVPFDRHGQAAQLG